MWQISLRDQLVAQPAKIFGLDAWRGLAALLVFGFHWYGFFGSELALPLWIRPYLAGGHIGINIFFVLSGFLVFLSYIRTPHFWSYLQRRLIRIVPLAWAYLAIVFWYKSDFSPDAWTDLWVHGVFAQSLFTSTYHGQFPVMWTLSVEMMFYIFVPLLAWLTRRNLRLFIFSLLVLVLLNYGYRWWLMRFFDSWNAFERIFYTEQLWGRFDHFALGIGLGLLYASGWITTVSRAGRWSGFFLFLFGLGGIGFGWYQFGVLGGSFRESVWLQVFLHSGIAISCVIALAGFIRMGQSVWTQNFLAPAWLQFLGKISYGIYLWHFFVLEVFMTVPLNSSYEGLVLMVMTTIGLSAMSWYSIEQPCLAWLRTKKKIGDKP